MKRFIAALLSAVSVFTLSSAICVSAEDTAVTTPQIPENAVEFNGSFYKVFNDRLCWLDAEL
ncbi:MAG: hypothetical protein IKL31_08875, partial [Ruminococcus sp.]|nr:hypothetical protein [Ruminococcus sp.]